MSMQNGGFDAQYGSENEVDREVYAWLTPETKRLVDVVHESEGYESRSAFIRSVLRQYFGLPTDETGTSSNATHDHQALLTDGGTPKKKNFSSTSVSNDRGSDDGGCRQ